MTAHEPTPTPTTHQLPPDAQMMQLVFGKIVTYALGGIARLNIADHLSLDEARPVVEVAAATGAHAPSLYRVLRTLASVGVFVESPGQQFALTPVGALLRSDSPRSLRNMIVMMTDPWTTLSYQRLDHCIRTGEDSVTAVHGKHAFDVFREDPLQAEHFHRAMTDFSNLEIPAILQAADFSSFRKIADVGGGHGALLGGLLDRFKHLQGVLFELPETAAGAPASGHFRDCEDRVEIQTGSFFECIPEGCDAYIMKHIIHDWDDGSSRRVLTLMRDQLAAAAPEAGRVFLFEMVVPATPEPAPVKMIDIEMLVCTRGGKERTQQEFADLFSSAGLQLVGITPTQSPVCLIEAKLG